MLIEVLLLQILERPLHWQRSVAWALLVGLMIALFHVGSQPGAGGLFPSGWDKLVHVLYFGGIAALAYVGTGSRRPIFSIVLIAFFGMLDEVGQSFNPSRVSSAADWVADIAGAGLAVVFLKLVAAHLRARHD